MPYRIILNLKNILTKTLLKLSFLDFPLGWIALQSICSFLFQTAANQSWESEEQASLPGTPPILPSMDCIAIHPSPTFFKPPRSEEGSLRDNVPQAGLGGSPASLHSILTFRPSIIAARALRENASNCRSVMCSIRLSGLMEPAAVVLAVGTL